MSKDCEENAHNWCMALYCNCHCHAPTLESGGADEIL